MLKRPGKIKKAADIVNIPEIKKVRRTRVSMRKIKTSIASERPNFEGGKLISMKVAPDSMAAKKEMVAWTLISMVMVIIFVFWGMNLRARTEVSAETPKKENNDLVAIGTELGARVAEMKNQLETIRQFASSTEASRMEANNLSKNILQKIIKATSSSESVSSMTVEGRATSMDINLSKEKLDLLKKKLNTTNPEHSGQN